MRSMRLTQGYSTDGNDNAVPHVRTPISETGNDRRPKFGVRISSPMFKYLNLFRSCVWYVFTPTRDRAAVAANGRQRLIASIKKNRFDQCFVARLACGSTSKTVEVGAIRIISKVVLECRSLIQENRMTRWSVHHGPANNRASQQSSLLFERWGCSMARSSPLVSTATLAAILHFFPKL